MRLDLERLRYTTKRRLKLCWLFAALAYACLNDESWPYLWLPGIDSALALAIESVSSQSLADLSISVVNEDSGYRRFRPLLHG